MVWSLQGVSKFPWEIFDLSNLEIVLLLSTRNSQAFMPVSLIWHPRSPLPRSTQLPMMCRIRLQGFPLFASILLVPRMPLLSTMVQGLLRILSTSSRKTESTKSTLMLLGARRLRKVAMSHLLPRNLRLAKRVKRMPIMMNCKLGPQGFVSI